jgi:hypothetical protein
MMALRYMLIEMDQSDEVVKALEDLKSAAI